MALTQTFGGGSADSGTAAQYPSPGSDQSSDRAADDAAGGAESEEGADAAGGNDEAADDAAVYDTESELGALASGSVVVLPDLGRVGPDDLGETLRRAQLAQDGADEPPSLTEGEARSC